MIFEPRPAACKSKGCGVSHSQTHPSKKKTRLLQIYFLTCSCPKSHACVQTQPVKIKPLNLNPQATEEQQLRVAVLRVKGLVRGANHEGLHALSHLPTPPGMRETKLNPCNSIQNPSKTHAMPSKTHPKPIQIHLNKAKPSKSI